MSKFLHLEENNLLMAQREKSRGIFSTLPIGMKKKLLAGKTVRNFSDNQLLQQLGDKARGFWVIEKGLVHIGRYLEQGQLQILLMVSVGDSFGELSCFTKDPRPVDAIATGDVKAYWIECNELMEAIAEFPECTDYIMSSLAGQLQLAMEIVLVQRLQNSTDKLKWNLSFFCSDMPPPINLPLSQHDLADMTGVSRMTVSKSLKELEDQGILTREYGQLQILKPELLIN